MSGTFNETARVSRTNGMAIASMVLGIIGVFVASIILGPLAVIFGVVGLRRTNAGASGRGMALTGIILGVIDIVLFVILAVFASKNGYRWTI